MAVLNLQPAQWGVQYQVQDERDLKPEVSSDLRDGAGEPNLAYARNNKSKGEQARSQSRAAKRQPARYIPYFWVVVCKLVLAKVGVLDDEDGDECRTPISDEAQEVGDRGVEAVRAYDGDWENPTLERD